MPKPFPRLSDNRVLAPTQTALSLNLITQMDLLRLKVIARLYARGLPADVAWDDLLQEAMTRVLTGRRERPDGVPMVGFLAGVMRSLRADHVRRARLDAVRDAVELVDQTSDPERALIATDQLEKIRLLFAGDLIVQHIIDGLAEGLSAEQIRSRHDFSKKDYDSARKRMRRCLLREGLTWGRN